MKCFDVVIVAGGRYSSKPRPVLVYQRDDFYSGDSIVIIPFTSRFNPEMPDRPFLSPSQKNGLERDSYLEIDKVSAIDRDCIAQRVGRISDDDIKIVNSEMAKMLPLGER